MTDKRRPTIRRYSFSAEDQERLLEDTIREWQALGPAAIWRATWELSRVSAALRGEVDECPPMDRTKIVVRKVPWADGADCYGQEHDT